MGNCCVGGQNLGGSGGGCGTLAHLCPFSLGVCLLGCLSPRVSLSPFSGRERQGPAAGGAPGLTCVAGQGEFRVAERKVTMKELLRALEEGRVREVFGSGTACQVCPVHQILYQGKVRWAAVGDGREKGGSWSSRRCLLQHLHIPTMENGPELILRFLKELKAIQVRCTGWEGGWMFVPRGGSCPRSPCTGSPAAPQSQEPRTALAMGPWAPD